MFVSCSEQKRWESRDRSLQLRLLPYDHLGPDGNTIVEIGDVVVHQAEAAGGNLGADRVGAVGAVDAVDGGSEIHGAGAERIAGAAGHEARQVGVACDALRRWGPVGPFLLVGYVHESLPLEAVAADADAVAHRAAAGPGHVEGTLRGRDGHGAARLGGGVNAHLLL